MNQPDRTSPAEVSRPVFYGIRLGDLNDEHMGQIVKIFDNAYTGRVQEDLNYTSRQPSDLVKGPILVKNGHSLLGSAVELS